MYFLNDEERKYLLRGLLPKAREMEIADDLRGWNWNRPPLEPVYDNRLALYEVAGKYCPTGRDVYLRRVHGAKGTANGAMARGSAFHKAMVDVIVRAKRLVYEKGVARADEILSSLRTVTEPADVAAFNLPTEEVSDVQRKSKLISEFEADRIAARLQDLLARQPYIGEDSLVSLAIPVVVEQKLDGSFLGFSQHLSADAYLFSEPMILDLKFGPPEKFHRLTTTGYALVMESIYEYPINIGSLVYGEFKGNRLSITKDFHIIDDELRQWFIEERDEKMRMVYEENDPGLADNCQDTCPYYRECYA